jgi:BMFP domain-containing protein YqiC
MQTSNRVLDDLAKVANGAVSTLVGIKAELDALIRQRLERLVDRLDLVPREEFDAVKAMAAKARAEQEKLERRVAELEARLVRAARPARRTSAKKPARRR